ncbi:GLOBIN domain-containing protein [Aphelenchoides fujianensis]|nr:GLOBIN domain-containing protein [Aphelenchoides fujianensis]
MASCCASMTSYIAKMPNVARQAVGYISHLFGGASTSSRVSSVDVDPKAQPTQLAAHQPAPATANGQTAMAANGNATKENGGHEQANGQCPYKTRQRSLDAVEILTWDPDPTEKELIKMTWTDDFNFLYELGSSIYKYIFDHMPECKKLFPAIHAHGDDYKDSREFRAQALKFVQTIAYTVKNIYHMQDSCAPHLYRIGARHVAFAARGFKPEMWDMFLDAMEYCLTDQVGSIASFDDAQRAHALRVWRRLAFYIIQHMKKGYCEELARQRAA